MTTTDHGVGRRHSLEQERAAYAWDYIQSVKAVSKQQGEQDGKRQIEKDYRSRVRGFGPMVLANGLGPALAFLYAKRSEKNQGDSYALLLQHVAGWLVKKGIIIGNDANALASQIGTMPLAQYRQARSEALAILVWLKRFAEGALEEPENSREDV